MKPLLVSFSFSIIDHHTTCINYMLHIRYRETDRIQENEISNLFLGLINCMFPLVPSTHTSSCLVRKKTVPFPNSNLGISYEIQILLFNILGIWDLELDYVLAKLINVQHQQQNLYAITDTNYVDALFLYAVFDIATNVTASLLLLCIIINLL